MCDPSGSAESGLRVQNLLPRLELSWSLELDQHHTECATLAAWVVPLDRLGKLSNVSRWLVSFELVGLGRSINPIPRFLAGKDLVAKPSEGNRDTAVTSPSSHAPATLIDRMSMTACARRSQLGVRNAAQPCSSLGSPDIAEETVASWIPSTT